MISQSGTIAGIGKHMSLFLSLMQSLISVLSTVMGDMNFFRFTCKLNTI